MYTAQGARKLASLKEMLAGNARWHASAVGHKAEKKEPKHAHKPTSSAKCHAQTAQDIQQRNISVKSKQHPLGSYT
jgi:hypothetical protein